MTTPPFADDFSLFSEKRMWPLGRRQHQPPINMAGTLIARGYPNGASAQTTFQTSVFSMRNFYYEYNRDFALQTRIGQ